MPTARTNLGNAGETIARDYLERQGMCWIEGNWRCLSGEIDLVMRDGDELAFVEVKTRRGDAAGRAEESVSISKGKKLLATGSWYVQAHPTIGDPIWRVDLVAITLSKSGKVVRLNHIVNAVLSG